MKHDIELTDWAVKEHDPTRTVAEEFAAGNGWMGATVPGAVHQDLMAAGRIADPFGELNELDVQWIGERDWLYRATFQVTPEMQKATSMVLCFDGLDTFATVWLNGQQVLISDNMFVPHRIPIGALARVGRNDVWILFESAVRIGKEREAEHGQLQVWNGDPSRVYVRKAQYHYGWDWGPTLMTAGVWARARVETYHARIAEVHCPVEVADDLSSACLPVTVTVEADKLRADLTLSLDLYDPTGTRINSATMALSDGAKHTFEIASPKLWWPNGYGDQNLYRLVTTLSDGSTEWDRHEMRLGVRRVRVRQEPLEDVPGTSFLFEVNNTPIFCGGANWIPADSFLPSITPERYRAWIQLTADANMTMLRVWGGGIYEPDIFYDLCDEMGLLVWQDFAFGCGIYPAYPDFRESVRAEAEAAVKRLRHHACLALWCGNNEDYLIALSFGLYDPNYDGDLAASKFPARALYEELLPEVCERLDPTRMYWPGSPYAGADPNDGTVGDRHTWDIWHGKMAPYQEYPAFSGRFVSEFGMQSFPARATIDAFAAPAERYAESRTMEHHNKAEGGPRRIAVYVNDTVRAPTDLDGAIYATQLVQAEAMGAAIRGWRRRFRGEGRYEVAGALVWQLNDCWPVTSWAIVDYHLRAKPAYYVIGRELAPLKVGVARTAQGAAVWAVNSTFDAVEADIELTVWTLAGERGQSETRTVTLPPHQATELEGFAFDMAGALVLAARLVVNGEVVSRATLWSEPFKYLTLPDPHLNIVRNGDDLRLRVTRPAKGVWLTAKDGVTWSDNMLDLMPDDEQIVTARGLGSSRVDVTWLRSGEPSISPNGAVLEHHPPDGVTHAPLRL